MGWSPDPGPGGRLPASWSQPLRCLASDRTLQSLALQPVGLTYVSLRLNLGVGKEQQKEGRRGGGAVMSVGLTWS